MVNFPNLFNIALDKNSSIAQNRTKSYWDVHLRRAVQDWEMGSLVELLATIESFNSNEDAPDRPNSLLRLYVSTDLWSALWYACLTLDNLNGEDLSWSTGVTSFLWFKLVASGIERGTTVLELAECGYSHQENLAYDFFSYFVVSTDERNRRCSDGISTLVPLSKPFVQLIFSAGQDVHSK
ncbi:hypothetical protein MTR67_019053 [Solanum verrucosum]|uniref:Uncharacterized protein n=1 Tax=Solanum verrucosum TaxID=315347 RepID=A0AAF0QNR6_SOLVR|nr:hypothetical protein MTR67_019053 [Solanum verrucosum]